MNVIKSGHFLSRNITRTLPSVCNKNARLYSSEFSAVSVDIDNNGIATIKMNNPPVNIMSLQLITGIRSALKRIEKEKPKGMILTSGAKGIFSAGLDITLMYKPNEEKLVEYWKNLQNMWMELYTVSCPAVAFLTGHAMGGGCLMACSCDYRVMLNGKGKIGLNETQIGVGIPPWFIETFKSVVVDRKADLALISGKLFSPKEALEISLVDELANDENDGIAKSTAYIKGLAGFNQTAMAMTKVGIRGEILNRLKSTRDTEIEMYLKYARNPETQKSLGKYISMIKT